MRAQLADFGVYAGRGFRCGVLMPPETGPPPTMQQATIA